MIHPGAWRFHCGTCRRVREVMTTAPWSSFDLLASLIVTWIGVYLWLMPDMFGHIGGVYAAFARLAPEWVWGTSFCVAGGIGLMTVLWCVRPRFGWRLLARMGVAFCLLLFAFNNLSHFPPPLSAVTYVWLSLWALWGVVRTRSYDR